jgi:hypothetical protein
MRRLQRAEAFINGGCDERGFYGRKLSSRAEALIGGGFPGRGL